MFHGAVVKYLFRKFSAFRTGPVEQTVIYNENVFALLICQRPHKIADDPGGKQGSKAEPVCFNAVKETVDCIF